ncbi:hypothetical protein GCM10009616_12640 [Microlunatus lacustris]
MPIEPPQLPGLTDWRPLARGGFAVVWEARQVTLDRLVAVKVDQRRLDAEPERLRFLREAGAAGQMSAHPGIVTVHDAGILADDRPYLVMELCPGGSLTRYLDPAARPSAERVREIGVRIADALAATHARGVLHRDVKPANILVDAYDRVGLADFGLAALPGPEAPPGETTGGGATEGVTPAYSAPEVLRQHPPTPAGDVYSLAATLYALLSGRPPRWPDGPAPTLADVVASHREPLQPVPDVDPGLMAALAAALDLDPAARPSAAELRDRLAALPLAASAPVTPAPGAVVARADTGTSGASAPRRRRALVLPLAVVVLAALLVGALLLLDRGPGTAAPAATPAGPGASPASSPSSAAPARTPAEPAPTEPGAGAAVPAGYLDCSQELGGTSFCPTEPECWAGVISVFDLPRLGTPSDCEETHVYQTFAAGRLEGEVRRQSQLEEQRAVARLCDDDGLEEMLTGADRETDWEVLALPPQEADGSDRIYRCLFGRGDRVGPVELRTR